MKKLITIFLVFLLLNIKLFAQSSNQYSVQEGMVVYDEGTFEEGVDNLWNPSAGQYAPRYWTTAGPFYSYIPGTTDNVMATTTDPHDNINYWDVFGNSNGVSGYTGYGDMDYQLYIPTSKEIFTSDNWAPNYQNWNGYSNIQFKWYGWNSDTTKDVVLEVFAYTQANGGQWLMLTPEMYRAPNTIYVDTFALGGFTSAQLSQISYIKFRVPNNYLAPGDSNHCGRQRTHLYSIKLTNDTIPSSSTTFNNQTITSHFLGTVFHRRYGSYSATGFYDTGMNNPGVFKIWFGGGTPNGPAQDNVWYVQSSTMDPAALKDYDLNNPTRCTVTPTNLWVNNNGEDWDWGDPSVIRFMTSWNPPSCVYYMFVSAMAVGTNWNQVYRVYSTDGINWTINPTTPVVAASNGGVAGYGSGDPSVVVAKGYYWLWYYSQYESAGPGEYLRQCTDGVSWGAPIKTNVSSGMDVKYIDSLNEFVAVSDVGIQGAGVYSLTSTDGINWSGGAPPYLSQDPNAYICHNPGFIGTDQGHGWSNMYVTYGASQEAITPTEYYTRELEYSSWHISNNSPKIRVKQENSNAQVSFSLSQNYPNPFNPSTEIKYSVAKSGLVTLKVYNLLGQEVETLINQEQKAGNYIVNFNASRLASGVYMYRIQSTDISIIKKMALLK
ncbi:MAG: T9SS type A sorting domain-containing protein [Ignavibacteriaceae bacterium]